MNTPIDENMSQKEWEDELKYKIQKIADEVFGQVENWIIYPPISSSEKGIRHDSDIDIEDFLK